MLRVGLLYEDDDLSLSHASIDGVLAFDKTRQRTQVASAYQSRHLEDTVSWLSRLGVPDDESPLSLPTKLTYALFAAAIIFPEHPRSQEIMTDQPERLAARMLAAADAMVRAREPQPPTTQVAPHGVWHRAATVVSVAGFGAMIIAVLSAVVWEQGRQYAVEDLLAGERHYRGIGAIFAAVIRTAFWGGLIIGVTAGLAVSFRRQILRLISWVKHG